MDIILLADIDKVGDKHDVVKVKAGYARNYLIPKGLAAVANKTNKSILADSIRQEDARQNKMLDAYKTMADQLQSITLQIGAKTGTTGKIFGSVTNVQIAQALKEHHGIEIERKKIHITDEVKEVGSYEANIDLHREVKTKVKFEVVAE
ncbi:MAG: 50S ribosomal protein L9 [Saprospiraceae bacterium]|jgi:large subunit ribosomal protein L9|nr:50S ribosomal protein L9 [Saprospiraceae bacterium]